MKDRRIESNKSAALVALTIVSWVGVSLWSWISYERTIPTVYGMPVWILLQGLHIGWMLFWIWGIHNFWHQTLSLLPRRSLLCRNSDLRNQAVAILYMTCDDFDSQACQSCLDQSHPKTRLIICDDSMEDHFRGLIDQWAGMQRGHVTVARRRDRKGFKAGNLNNAIRNFVDEEFVLICDADEIIPPDFVARVLEYFNGENIGFVQANHKAHSKPKTRFAAMLGSSVEIFNRYCLPLRNRFGFVSCFGHGVMIRRSVWSLCGGFPEIVCEDIGFASRALVKGFRGVFAEDVIAEEAFPPSYKSFITKYRRIIGGTIEYFQKEFWLVVKSTNVTTTEKLDILLTFSFCYIGLISIINVFCSLVFSYLCKVQGYHLLQPWLLCLYLIGPLTPLIPVAVNLLKSPKKYALYLFSGAIAYVSLLPTLAIKSIEQTLKFRILFFEVTGKVGRERQTFREHLWSVAVGLCTLSVAFWLRSPVFAPSVTVSLMFLLGPLMCLSERIDLLGFLSRQCGLIPYLVLISLIYWGG